MGISAEYTMLTNKRSVWLYEEHHVDYKEVMAGIREYCEVKFYNVCVDDDDILGDLDIPNSVKSKTKPTE